MTDYSMDTLIKGLNNIKQIIPDKSNDMQSIKFNINCKSILCAIMMGQER